MNKLTLSLVLACSALAQASDPEYRQPVLITLIDTQAAAARCAEQAFANGDYVSAVAFSTIAPPAACAFIGADHCWIIAPVSPGIGQVWAAVGAFTEPDEVLGHELSHCIEQRDFHPPQPSRWAP